MMNVIKNNNTLEYKNFKISESLKTKKQSQNRKLIDTKQKKKAAYYKNNNKNKKNSPGQMLNVNMPNNLTCLNGLGMQTNRTEGKKQSIEE